MDEDRQMDHFMEQVHSLHEKGLVLLHKEVLLVGQIGPSLRSPKLQEPWQTVASSEVCSTAPTDVTLVDDVQIASTSHLRTLRPSEYSLQSAICLWFQLISFVAVQGEDEAEPSGIRDPFLPLIDLAVQKCTQPPPQCSLDQDQQWSLSIHCTVECLCCKVLLRCTEYSGNISESRSSIILEHLTYLLKIFLGLQDTTLKLMDVHPSQHGERRLSLSGPNDIPHGQSLEFLPIDEMLKVGLELTHPSGHFIAEALHLNPLLEVVLEGFLFDEVEETTAAQLPVFTLPDQSRHLPHVNVLEDILGPCHQTVHLNYHPLLQLQQIPFRSLGEEEEGTAVAGHEFIEGIEFNEF